MNTEVVVCGGGLVGCTLACALAEADITVTVIEANPIALDTYEAIEPRVSSLTRASESLLTSLGVWRHLPENRIQTFHSVKVWDRTRFGEIEFDAADIGEPHLGHIIENKVLEHALVQRLGELSGVTWVRPGEVRSLVLGDRVVVAAGQQTIQAELVVGADGTNSVIRDLAGIEVTRGSYEQSAVVAIIVCDNGHDQTAWQRFLPSGPVAVLPMFGERACVVWSQTPQRADELRSMSPGAFDYELERVIGDHLGRLRSEGPRYAFPLGWLHAGEYVRDRLALVGDAAHTIHPLAGQGVNLGLADAAALAEVIAEARSKGRDPMRRRTLRRYERWRRGPNQLMHYTMDGFFGLFGNEHRAVSSLRNLGLRATDRVVPLKRMIMRHASGLVGDLAERSKTIR